MQVGGFLHPSEQYAQVTLGIIFPPTYNISKSPQNKSSAFLSKPLTEVSEGCSWKVKQSWLLESQERQQQSARTKRQIHFKGFHKPCMEQQSRTPMQ